MKQIFQDLANGETSLVEIPTPQCRTGQVTVATRRSVLSSGTEKMLVDFGKANWIDKARQQPDKVRMVLDKIRTDGLMPTVDAVRSKLEQPLPLGYCNAGVVLSSGLPDYKSGDRVVSNGPHAEVIRTTGNLCARIPDNVDDETASYTVLGSIALQGVRLADPTLGESVVVIGLGIIGLLTVQILRANGCHVVGVDFDEARCNLAGTYGADVVKASGGADVVSEVEALTNGRGSDAVIITAATTSNEPVQNAARMSRKRGRIVLVGVAGLDLSRADFYEKELTFQVSCSYGPGRYDSSYEDDGNDYPIGFVRWTEQRNFEAILRLMSEGLIDTQSLTTHRYSFDNALEAYSQLENRSALGIVLEYAGVETHLSNSVRLADVGPSVVDSPSAVSCGFIGAGNYAARVLLPAFEAAGASLDTIISSGGSSAVRLGKKHGARLASTDEAALYESERVNTVVVATRHDAHAGQVVRALENRRNVFVEKPLAITVDELEEIESAYDESEGCRLMVGFNRRFAPQSVRLKELLASKMAAKSLIMTVNAGEIPKEHWTQDLKIGGGRIIGECCHFVDLMRFLVGAKITGFNVTQMGGQSGESLRDDKVTISLSFADGSFGSIHYLANGSKSFPKERLEVFCDGAVIALDNFKKMRAYGWGGFQKMNLRSQDKGNRQCVDAFVKSIVGGQDSPIAVSEIFEVSRVTIDIANSLVR